MLSYKLNMMPISQLLSIGIFWSNSWSLLSYLRSGIYKCIVCRTGTLEFSATHLDLTILVAFRETDLLKKKTRNECTHSWVITGTLQLTATLFPVNTFLEILWFWEVALGIFVWLGNSRGFSFKCIFCCLIKNFQLYLQSECWQGLPLQLSVFRKSIET